MKTDLPVWGISKWRDFEQCPAMYLAKYVTKEWIEAPNDAMDRGKKIHKTLEDSLKYELELPADLQHVDGLIQTFIGMKPAGAALYPEMKFGVDYDFKRCDFFDAPGLRVRCVLDVFLMHQQRLLITDWKTGKYKGDHKEDAQFYGALGHTAFEAEETHVHYNYLDEPHNCFTDRAENIPSVLKVWWQKFDYADKQIASGNVPVQRCNACKWCGAWKCPNNQNAKINGRSLNEGMTPHG